MVKINRRQINPTPNRGGRRKIEYSQEELERQPLIEIVCGMKEVGKTHFTLIELGGYTRSTSRRPGRKALVLDFSEDDMYSKFPPVHPNHIRQLTEPRARRIVPYEKNGKQFTLDRMKEVAEYCIFNFKNGLLVIEDIDKYLYGSHGKALIGALTTNRHSGLDCIITHQSVSKISQTEWQNASYIRLHHQIDDVSRIHDRMPNYPLVKIAQLIVDRKYFQAIAAYREKGLISDLEFKKRRSFFIYINQQNMKLVGCNEEDFKIGAMQFIRENPRAVNKKMRMGDERGKKYTREEAIKELYKEYAFYYGGEQR